MKVILKQTVAKLGKSGQVVTVADGYARNYLFPRQLAVLADKKQIEALQRIEARVAAKSAETKAAAETLAETLRGKTVKIEAKVGRDGTKLFGAITSQDVADAVKAQLGTAIEKKDIALHDAIKRLGRYTVVLDLHRDVDAEITVHVFDPANVQPEPETVEELVEA